MVQTGFKKHCGFSSALQNALEKKETSVLYLRQGNSSKERLSSSLRNRRGNISVY